MHVARAARVACPDARPPVTLVGPDAPERAELLLNGYPELAPRLDLRALRAHAGAFGAATEIGEPRELLDVDTLYVDAVDDPDGAAAAVTLGGRSARRRTVLVVSDDSEGAARALRRMGMEDTAVIGALRSAFEPSAASEYLSEALARAIHVRYQRNERELGVTVDDNPSMAPWNELPESLKESNMAFAQSVWDKLRRVSGEVVSAPLDERPAYVFAPGPIEELAREEHERWCTDLRARGWEHTTGPKDPDRKLQPLLVPWEELDERERDKDRAHVAAIPALLAEVGGLQVYPGAAGAANVLVPNDEQAAVAAR
jgi:hypothetical protein